MELRLLPAGATPEQPEMLDAYQARGGYEAWRRVLAEGDRDAVVEQVEASGLSGRGGAGFSTAKKWSFMPRDADGRAFIAMNADESEPGTFKDRYLMERAPHLVLEGLLLACFATGATRGYVFLRFEYPQSQRTMQRAIDEARRAGLLGEHIQGAGTSIDVVIRKGAGTYISGEEMGLLESLEGRRAFPRQKPPFPANRGAFGKPTTVNNVETLACVPLVLGAGAEAFAAMGHGRSTGPKLYCLSGHVRRPGVYESPMTVTLRELVFDDGFGGGVSGGRDLKAVIPGGSSAPVMTADQLDVPADFDHLADAGSMIGSAGVIVMDETVCMVRAALNTIRFFDHETCGQCTPCREGCHWMHQVLERFEAGRGRAGEIDLMFDRLAAIEGQTICPFGDAVTWGVRSFLERFTDEFDEHVRLGRCPLPEWDFRQDDQ